MADPFTNPRWKKIMDNVDNRWRRVLDRPSRPKAMFEALEPDDFTYLTETYGPQAVTEYMRTMEQENGNR